MEKMSSSGVNQMSKEEKDAYGNGPDSTLRAPRLGISQMLTM
jgi:hypothetical protein